MPKWVAGLAGVLVVALAVGLWAFEPWRAFTSSTIDEALPTASSSTVPQDATLDDADTSAAALTPRAKSDSTTTGTKAGNKPGTRAPEPTPVPTPVPEVVELASGQFEDAEYDTNGVATIIRLADGSRFVRLEDFSTSDGPDVFVGLSDSPSGGSWGSYDDLRYLQLGSLKATDGNQNYEIPADVDLAGFESVVIWCDRFNVAFGTAPVAL